MFFYRVISLLFLLGYYFEKSVFKNENNDSKVIDYFLIYNNNFVINRIRNIKIASEKIVLLLPHCIQYYNCNIKVTNEIKNCINCKKCEVGEILNMVQKYGVDSKIATGGTLARKYLTEKKPKLVIAVACPRDLISGIFDSYPLLVYGIMNVRKEGPCINTGVDVSKIEKVIKKILLED